MEEQPRTEELRDAQEQRTRAERERADASSDEEAVRAHERRADKAAYLERKLAEQADSESQG